MPYFEGFGCQATIIGSLPHTDPVKACATVAHYLKDIPTWPQLPKRSFLENMYVQFSEGFPGAVLKDEMVQIDRSQDLSAPLEKLYAAYLEGDFTRYPVSPRYAAGLHQFLSMNNMKPKAVKGHITGPVSWGLTVTDTDKRPIIYDDVLGDVVPRLLKLKASWQEKLLRQISPNTIMFVDEPYMSAYGSISSSAFSREKVIGSLEEVFGGISGLKGIHCCGNTDWSVLLATSTDIINFDAYNYAQSLSLFLTDVKKFLERGGIIAWGIVPNDKESLAKESVASLEDRIGEAISPFTRAGIRFKQILKQSLLTPSCGLASLGDEEQVNTAFELLTRLSAKIREKYL